MTSEWEKLVCLSGVAPNDIQQTRLVDDELKEAEGYRIEGYSHEEEECEEV